MRKAILQHLDDLEDYYLAVQRLEENLPASRYKRSSAALAWRIEFQTTGPSYSDWSVQEPASCLLR